MYCRSSSSFVLVFIDLVSQGSSGSRKSSFDSPGVLEEEAEDGIGDGAGLRQVNFQTNRQTCKQTIMEDEIGDGLKQVWQMMNKKTNK